MAILSKASDSAALSSNDFVLMAASIHQIDSHRAPKEASRAEVLLAHAIEHLSDQYVLEDDADQATVLQAIQILMELHGAIYAQTAGAGESPRQPLWGRLLAG